MISYDQYENRIKKLAKFKSFMNRFKFLFIAISALIIATIATLLALKGSLSGEIRISSSTYGESYSDPEGVSAFLSSVSYEYAREGSDEWSAQKPVKAGRYSVRAVSNKTIGKDYGKTASFEIAPREVTFTILGDSMEYGGVPKYTLDLLAGDTLNERALLFKYGNDEDADYLATHTEVNLDENSVIITNGADDRSSCYTVKHEKKELDITKRNIDVSLKQFSFTYSGSAVQYTATESSQTAGRLANGDIIRFSSVQFSKGGVEVANAVYAGSYEVFAQEVHIYKVREDGREIEVTDQYDTSASSFSGVFTIEKKSVTVETPSKGREYDGTPLVRTEGFTTEGLIEGDIFTVSRSTSITNVDSVRNEFLAYAVKNGDNDLSANYDITFRYGTLTVSPRKIIVKSSNSPDNEDWIYDGTAKSLAEVSFEDEFFKAVAETEPRTYITTVGTVFNVVDYKIYNKLNEPESTTNFDITEEWGTLKVTKRNVTITIQHVTKVYDGMPLYASPEKGEVKVTLGTLGTGDELVSDISNDARHEIIDVIKESGLVKAIPNSSTYKIVCASGDRTANYNIEYVRGTLTVTPRHITVLSESEEFVYDGEPHSNGGYIVYENGKISALYAGNVITLKESAPAFTTVSQTKGASQNNKCEYDVGDNYVIDNTEYGTITILPRKITIYTNSDTFIYDGDDHWNNGYTTKYGDEKGLCRTDELFAGKWATVRYVSDTISGNNDCTYKLPNDNYEIDGYVYGTLTVKPRPIRVVTDDAEKVYDGDPLSNHAYVKTYYIDGNGNEQAGLLKEGETLSKKDSFSITNVWESGYNKCTFSVPNENYSIADNAYDYGTLTITARPLTVVTANASKEYNGEPLLNDAYDRVYYVDGEGNEEEGLLQEGEVLTPIKSNSIINVHESGTDHVCTFSVPNGNYKIDNYVYGKLTITPKHITVKLNDVDIVYGEDYREYQYPTGKNNFANAETCGFIGNDTVEVKIQFDLKNCNFGAADPKLIEKGILPVTWGNEIKWVLVREYGDIGYTVGGYKEAVTLLSAEFTGDFESNYVIEYSASTLYILRRVLTVGMNDATTFYGEDLHPTEEEYIYYAGNDSVKGVTQYATEEKGLLPDDSLIVTKVRYLDKSNNEEYVLPKSAGTYNIKPYEIVIRTSDGKEETTTDAEEDDTEGNYLVCFYDPGTLTIKQRPIQFSLLQIESTRYDGKVREYVTGEEVITLSALSDADSLLVNNPDGLVYGEKLHIAVEFNEPYPKNADKYSYAYDKRNSYIIDSNGEPVEGGLENYQITCNGTYSFEIFKREITLKMCDMERTYGESYPNDVDAIEYLKSVDVAENEVVSYINVTYVDCDGSVGTYVVRGSDAMILKFAENGMDGFTDVTKNYDIDYVDGSLKISQKQVNVTVNTRTVRYGEAIRPNEYSISSLAGNEQMTLTFAYPTLPAGKGVGKYIVTITPVLSRGKSLDNYHITYYDEEGTELDTALSGGVEVATLEKGLVIEELPIFVSVEASSFMYGEDIQKSSVTVTYTLSDGTVSNTLPYGEKLNVEVYAIKGNDRIEPKYAGTYNIKIGELSIEGKPDGLLNYDVTRADAATNGTLTITPRPIFVKLDSLTITYGDPMVYTSGAEGKRYSFAEENVNDFVNGDELIITPNYYTERLDTGTYSISSESYSITNGGVDTIDGYFIADSYDIKIYDGKLTVEKREVTLTLDQLGDDVTYDGLAHNYDLTKFTAPGILEGEKLEIAVKYKFSKTKSGNKVATDDIAKAGYYSYEFDLSKSSVKNGGSKGIDNYTFTNESYGIYYCQILQQEITIKISDMEAVTYGESVTYASGAKEYVGLIEGETLEIFVTFRNKETLAVYENSIGLVLPAGEYEIIPSALYNAKVYSSNVPNYADIDNYDIDYKYGALKVNKREITITLNDVNVDYGETAVYPNRAGNYNKVEGHLGIEQITVKVNISLLPYADADTYENAVTFDSAVIKLGNENVTVNYTVTCAPSDVIVSPRKIVVTTPTLSFVYDGEAHTAEDYTIVYAKDTTKGLAYEDKSEIVGVGVIPSVTDVSPEKTTNEYAIIVKSNGKDVSTKNYVIEYAPFGEIWITPRPLYVVTKSDSRVYDGDAITSPDTLESIKDYSLIDGKEVAGLVKDHYFVIQPVTFTEADSKLNDIVVDVLDSSKVSKIHNYAIKTDELGTLTIEKRIIYVSAPSAEKVYDGDVLTSPEGKTYTLYFYPENNFGNTPIRVEWSKASDSTNGLLVNGQTFKVNVPSITNVGEKNNNPFEGVYQGAVSKTANYEFRFEDKQLGIVRGILKVTKRPVSYWIYDYEMDYCNHAPSTDALDYLIQQQEGKEGVLKAEKDSFDYKIHYVYSISNTQEVSRFNVGTYTMLFELGDFSKQNYEFKCKQYGNLTVDQVELLLIPAKKSENYGECQEIKMVIKEDGTKDDLERVGLVEGDVIKNAGFNSSSLKASENSQTKVVRISTNKVVIVDENGNNITKNYKITAQVGSMKFIRRTLYVQQIVPDYDYIQKNSLGGGSIAYTGKTKTIANNDNLFYVLSKSDASQEWVDFKTSAPINLENYEGLYGSDTAKFKSATVAKNVTKANALPLAWLTIDVVNGNGKAISQLYSVVFVDLKGTESSIKVRPEKVSVTFSSELTMEYLGKFGNGITLLDHEYFEVSSESAFFEEDYIVDAAVYKKKDGTVSICIFIYEPKYDKEGNVQSRPNVTIFDAEVKFESGIEVDAQITSTAGNYPATGDQGEESEA